MPTGIYTRTREHIDKIKNGLMRPDVFDKLSSGRKGKEPWNKGIKFGPNPEQSRRMKGRIPWNKWLKGVQSWSIKQRLIMSERQTGENHEQFTGTNLNYYNRLVKIRDDYTCQICGLRDTEIIQVDHILPKSKYPELRLSMDNMRCICPNCHARKSIKEKRKSNGLAIASVKSINGLA